MFHRSWYEWLWLWTCRVKFLNFQLLFFVRRQKKATLVSFPYYFRLIWAKSTSPIFWQALKPPLVFIRIPAYAMLTRTYNLTEPNYVRKNFMWRLHNSIQIQVVLYVSCFLSYAGNKNISYSMRRQSLTVDLHTWHLDEESVNAELLENHVSHSVNSSAQKYPNVTLGGSAHPTFE